MKFIIDIKDLEELKKRIDHTLEVCKRLNNMETKEKEILKKMNLTREQMELLVQLFEE